MRRCGSSGLGCARTSEFAALMLVVIANQVGLISWVARRPTFHQITEGSAIFMSNAARSTTNAADDNLRVASLRDYRFERLAFFDCAS